MVLTVAKAEELAPPCSIFVSLVLVVRLVGGLLVVGRFGRGRLGGLGLFEEGRRWSEAEGGPEWGCTV